MPLFFVLLKKETAFQFNQNVFHMLDGMTIEFMIQSETRLKIVLLKCNYHGKLHIFKL